MFDRVSVVLTAAITICSLYLCYKSDLIRRITAVLIQCCVFKSRARHHYRFKHRCHISSLSVIWSVSYRHIIVMGNFGGFLFGFVDHFHSPIRQADKFDLKGIFALSSKALGSGRACYDVTVVVSHVTCVVCCRSRRASVWSARASAFSSHPSP